MSKKLIALSLALVMAFTSVPLLAKQTTVTFRNGGRFTFTNFDSSEYSKVSLYRGEPAVRVDSLLYLTPSDVQAISNDLGKGALNSMVVGTIQSYIASGSFSLAKSTLSKAAPNLALKLNPYIGMASTAVSLGLLLDTYATAAEQTFYAKKAAQGKGLIIRMYSTKSKNGIFDNHGKITYDWDGSSPYGSYPYAVTPLAHDGLLSFN